MLEEEEKDYADNSGPDTEKTGAGEYVTIQKQEGWLESKTSQANLNLRDVASRAT